MGKHIQGPWELSAHPSGYQISGLRTLGKGPIAFIESFGALCDIHNAHLIAAAPDLLAALKLVRTVLPNDSGVLLTVEKAIAKAEGQAS